MNLSRREFVTLSVGVLAAGCAHNTVSDRPDPMWPDAAEHPRPTSSSGSMASSGSAYAPVPSSPSTLPPTHPAYVPPAQVAPPAQPVAPPLAPQAPIDAGPIRVIPRSAWARGGILPDRILAMDGVNRITVHHEGWKVVNYTDYVTTAQRMEEIRQAHLTGLHAGDIAYHFVIDRAGRVWQGRDVRYQGAHVRSENEHNIGVMCLGNFEEQSPTSAQLTTLTDTLLKLQRYYGVRKDRIYMHRELNQTLCPGRAMIPQVVAIRRQYFAQPHV